MNTMYILCHGAEDFAVEEFYKNPIPITDSLRKIQIIADIFNQFWKEN